MKSLHVNFTDITGGAAQAANRLHLGLLKEGVFSNYYVSRKSSKENSVLGPSSIKEKIYAVAGPTLDCLPQKLRAIKQNAIFSNNIVPDSLLKCVNNIKPDILHLHWINGGFIKIESLSQIEVPIVWTLHDQWPFTGGCHYSGECDRFNEKCGCCPVLNSKQADDLSRKNWLRKQQAWRDLSMTIVSPSKWLANLARESGLFANRQIKVIPYGIDTEIFKPGNKNRLRKQLNLPLEKKIILYCASKSDDNRKGGTLLIEAINCLLKNKQADEFCLLLLGSTILSNQLSGSIQTISPGIINSEELMAQYYSASDIHVTPSKEDNLPNTVLESLASGTPVVAFNIGGMPDMIDHKVNGFLVKQFDVNELTHGIQWGLCNNHSRKLSKHARQKAVKEFSSEVSAKRYINLYNSLIHD